MLFELSPDGKHAAFPDVENRIAVLSLSTGSIEHVPVSESRRTESRRHVVLPSWKSSGELCVVRTFEKDAEVILCIPGQDDPGRIISAGWPSPLTESLAGYSKEQ